MDSLKYGFKVINSFDSEKILTELCQPYSKEKITYWDCGIIAKPNGFYLSCLNTDKHQSLKKVMSEYFSILKKNKQIDFEQILFYSYNLLIRRPVISHILCKIFPFILIDEYQDTKEIQYHIISKILSANKGKSKTLIVGDPNQSIYESLGGFPISKVDLEKLLGFNLLELSLTKNYRSSEKSLVILNIIRLFQILLRHMEKINVTIV